MKPLLIILLACLLTACSISRTGTSPNTNTQNSPAAALANTGPSGPGDTPGTKGGDVSDEIAVTKKDCEQTEVGDNALLKAQTFPVAFGPFKNTCFVTSYNPEYDDPPMESEIAIYKGDKKVFDFPDQFNGVTTGCWVEAVSFQDLNADALTDIIVVGKCSAKSAPYNENVVYVNTGKAFTTDENANYGLADLKKAGDIADFVKRNQKLFFK